MSKHQYLINTWQNATFFEMVQPSGDELAEAFCLDIFKLNTLSDVVTIENIELTKYVDNIINNAGHDIMDHGEYAATFKELDYLSELKDVKTVKYALTATVTNVHPETLTVKFSVTLDGDVMYERQEYLTKNEKHSTLKPY